jgi:hypothetical protein
MDLYNTETDIVEITSVWIQPSYTKSKVSLAVQKVI